MGLVLSPVLKTAMLLGENGAEIYYDRCIACNNCIFACPESLIQLNWNRMNEFIERMTEYALGAVQNKTGKGRLYEFPHEHYSRL